MAKKEIILLVLLLTSFVTTITAKESDNKKSVELKQIVSFKDPQWQQYYST